MQSPEKERIIYSESLILGSDKTIQKARELHLHNSYVQKKFNAWCFLIVLLFFLSLCWICYNTASVLCFGFFGCKACGTLALQPGIEPAPPALEDEVLTTGPPGKSLLFVLDHEEFSYLITSLKKKKKYSVYFCTHILCVHWYIIDTILGFFSEKKSNSFT